MAKGLGLFVDGKRSIQPGVISKVNIDAFDTFNTNLQKRLAVIATAQGGVPQGITLINSLEQARKVIKGGKGLELIELAMNPSPELSGAQEILFYRLNQAVISTLDLGDLTISATAENAGVYGNDIRIRRNAGTNGGVILEIENRATADVVESLELGPAFELEYVGTESSFTAEITDVAGTKTLILGDPNSTTPIAIGQGAMRTFDDLEEYLSTEASWQGVAIPGHRTFELKNLPLGTLTFDASNKTLLDLGSHAQVAFLSTIEYIDAEAQTNPASTLSGWQSLQGGIEGPVVTNADYLGALDAFSNEDVQVLITDSTDPDVHAQVNGHCKELSHPVERLERTFFCGIATEANAAAQTTAALDAAKALASERTMLIGTPLKIRNVQTERLEVIDANRVAAAIAGMYCGALPETPLTNKGIAAEAVGMNFSRKQVDDMVEGGVIAIKLDRQAGVHVIVEGITTWLKDNNALRRTTSGISVRDHLSRKLRNDTRRFIGAVGDQFTIEKIKQAIIKSLEEEVRSSKSRGVLISFDSVQVVYDGINFVEARFNAHPVGEVRNIKITAFLFPKEITV